MTDKKEGFPPLLKIGDVNPLSTGDWEFGRYITPIKMPQGEVALNALEDNHPMVFVNDEWVGVQSIETAKL